MCVKIIRMWRNVTQWSHVQSMPLSDPSLKSFHGSSATNCDVMAPKPTSARLLSRLSGSSRPAIGSKSGRSWDTHTKQWRHWSWWTVVDHETHMNTNKSQSITNIHWLAWKHDFLDCENGEQDCRSSTLRSLDHEKRTAFVMVNNCTQPFDTVYFTKNLSYIGVLSDNSSLTSSI